MKLNKKLIIEAQERIKGGTHITPILSSQSLNTISKSNLYFKCENFQKIGAFKMRGALNAVKSYNKEEIKRGFVSHSSGNHAQAVALSSKMMNTKAYIVMPKGAPKINFGCGVKPSEYLTGISTRFKERSQYLNTSR